MWEPLTSCALTSHSLAARTNITINSSTEWREREQFTEVDCFAVSVAPAPVINWYIGSGDFGFTSNLSETQIQADGSVSVRSTVHLSSSLYAGQNVTCTVEHPISEMSESQTINIPAQSTSHLFLEMFLFSPPPPPDRCSSSTLTLLIYLQKLHCWVFLWWDYKTLTTGWLCVKAEEGVWGRSSPGCFPKILKMKNHCTQRLRATPWRPGWLISFLWLVMKARIWPVCAELHTGSRRGGLCISPSTVSRLWKSEKYVQTTRIHKGIRRLMVGVFFCADISAVRVVNHTTVLRDRYGCALNTRILSLRSQHHSQRILLEVDGNVPHYDLSCTRWEITVVVTGQHLHQRLEP